VTQETQQWNASLYDGRHSFVWKYAEDMLGLLAPQSGERILDLGAGTGHLTAQIAAAGAHVVGLDASASMVEQARANYPELAFTAGDGANFAFPEPFDAVFSNATLHWITRAEDAVACIARALKPGGRFVAEFGGKGNVESLVSAMITARVALGLPVRTDLNPWYFPSVAQYATLVERHGLTVTYATLFFRPTPLDDGEQGLAHWITMFGASFCADIPANRLDEFIQNVASQLRSTRFHDGTWIADYRRLRIVATKD